MSHTSIGKVSNDMPEARAINMKSVETLSHLRIASREERIAALHVIAGDCTRAQWAIVQCAVLKYAQCVNANGATTVKVTK